MIKKVGLGGGCHWCTEAVFSSLWGIVSVKQGWIASDGENTAFSEGIIIEYDDSIIPLHILIAVHLHTHASTSAHSMRGKYRSAVYTFQEEDVPVALEAIRELQAGFDSPIITGVMPYADFKMSRDELQDYYFSNPEKPFCETYINPKLKWVMEQFSAVANHDKLKHLNNRS